MNAHTNWVLYHSLEWYALAEQGYATRRVSTWHGIRWALMVKQA